MPIPPIFKINGQTSWQPTDYSGVAFDYTKLATMPPSLYETEGYREHLDSESGFEIQRIWRCNWSDVAACMQWFIGYSLMADQKTLNSQAPSPNGQPPTSQPQGPSSHTLSRVVPAQDWYRPYLYADHVELIECLGVALADPNLILTDINGTSIDCSGTPGGTNILVAGKGPGYGLGSNLQAVGGASFSGLIASFEGHEGETYTAASVDWGDGKSDDSAEVVQEVGSQNWTISGAHFYQQPGEYDVTVSIMGSEGFNFKSFGNVTAVPSTQIQGDGILHNLPPGSGQAQQSQQPVKQQLPGLVFAEQAMPGVFSDGAATLRVTYRRKPFIIRNDTQQAANNPAGGANNQGELGRYVERVPQYAIQGIPLFNIVQQGQQLKFTDDQTIVPEAGVMLIPTASWKYIWHDVPFYPSAAILACQGMINAAPFDGLSGWPQFPTGTLLAQSPEIRMARNAAGQPSFTISWTLDYRPAGGLGWNAFPKLNGKFQTATFGGGPPAADGSNLVFKTADFGQLFAVGTTFAFV